MEAMGHSFASIDRLHTTAPEKDGESGRAAG